MNGAIIGFVLRRHRLTFIWCALLPVIVGALFGVLYPIYQREHEAIARLTKIVGKLLEGFDLLSIEGFIALVHQHLLSVIAGAIFAAVPALTLPAMERGRGALDLLLATRLRRRELVRSVAVASFLANVVFGFTPMLGIVIGTNIAGFAREVPLDHCAVIALNLIALTCCQTSIALCCSVVAEDVGGAVARYVGVLFAFIAIDVVARVWDAGKWLKWFTPYGYFRPHGAIVGYGIPWLAILVLFALAVAGVVAAETAMDRRRRA